MVLNRSKANPTPFRGEIWTADLDPTRGHEQAGNRRPCLIVSNNMINSGPAEMVFVIPLTSRNRNIPIHVKVGPPEGALIGVVLCDQLRAISKERLKSRVGVIKPSTLREVEDCLRIIMSL